MKVPTPDLQAAVEEQDNVFNMTNKLSWFEKYHPLDEVGSNCLNYAGKPQ